MTRQYCKAILRARRETIWVLFIISAIFLLSAALTILCVSQADAQLPSGFKAVLFHAGKFMAPEGDYEADVAILAGSEYVSKIFSTACFTEYELDQWWEKYPGVRDFGTEVLKLAYYMVGGHNTAEVLLLTG